MRAIRRFPLLCFFCFTSLGVICYQSNLVLGFHISSKTIAITAAKTKSSIERKLAPSSVTTITLSSRYVRLFSQSPLWAVSSNSIPSNVKILILPGFGNDVVDYTLPGSLVDSLQEQGWSSTNIDVLRVQRSDWLQVFWRGVWDVSFWRGDADPTRPAFSWYLQKISQQMEELCASTTTTTNNNEQCYVLWIGHSAGGWLGRAALGFGSIATDDANEIEEKALKMGSFVNLVDRVIGLVSLGTPHLPPPPHIMDMTRGALRITNQQFPGAYHKINHDIFYLTVIGLSIQGEQQKRKSPLEPTSVKGFAYNSYQVVCGNGTTIGDGVVPCCAAHLEDAVQLDLNGVLHSINAPDNWYGSSQVIEQWHGPMLKELNASKKLLGKNRRKNYSNNLADAFSSALQAFKL